MHGINDNDNASVPAPHSWACMSERDYAYDMSMLAKKIYVQ